ncbi:alpha-keto acid decarboxylase family protein [soil metagenome]
MTVIQYVLKRLHEIGVRDIFGVPGDYAFPVNDAICLDESIRWIGCCNELNAAYAADGYARINGIGALCTTYGVGELSALAGVAGSYAEHLPIFHLVGMPNRATQSSRRAMHHTLGNGEYDLFHRMSEPVVCASAIITPENAAYETERLISAALYHRRPVYMGFPADAADLPMVTTAEPASQPKSEEGSLEAAASALVAALKSAKSTCMLPGILIARAGLKPQLQTLVDASGLPFATMFMAKSVLDEQQPGYIGMYDGALMNEEVRQFVEGCDLVLAVGTIFSDFNTGAFTSNLDPSKVITIDHHQVKVNGKTFLNVEMEDILTTLAELLDKRASSSAPRPVSMKFPATNENEPITAPALYPRWEGFLRPDDILIAETGTVSMGLGFALMPAGATFHNQTLWGSIGWATPASFGAAVVAPSRRVILVTGEGSHQLTAQEISQFGRLGLKPIVFVLNNSGYLIERLLCKDPEIYYNDVAPWRYAELPHALGCDGWLTARVTTCGELDRILSQIQDGDSGAYIEVVTDKYAASDLALQLQQGMKALYKS